MGVFVRLSECPSHTCSCLGNSIYYIFASVLLVFIHIYDTGIIQVVILTKQYLMT